MENKYSKSKKNDTLCDIGYASDSTSTGSTVSLSSKIEFLACAFERRIVTSVRVEEILPRLHYIDLCEKRRIYAVSRNNGDVKGMEELLMYLKSNRTPGGWQNFVDALEEADYNIIVGLLRGERELTDEAQKQILHICAPLLARRLYFREMVDKLLEKGVINDEDTEALYCKEKESPIQAGYFLLERIPSRIPNWFEEFIYACKDCQLQDVIDQFLEPNVQQETGDNSSTHLSHQSKSIEARPLPAIPDIQHNNQRKHPELNRPSLPDRNPATEPYDFQSGQNLTLPDTFTDYDNVQLSSNGLYAEPLTPVNKRGKRTKRTWHFFTRNTRKKHTISDVKPQMTETDGGDKMPVYHSSGYSKGSLYTEQDQAHVYDRANCTELKNLSNEIGVLQATNATLVNKVNKMELAVNNMSKEMQRSRVDLYDYYNDYYNDHYDEYYNPYYNDYYNVDVLY